MLIYIEQEGGSGGKEIAQIDIGKLAGFPAFIDVVSGQRTRQKDGQELPGPAKVVRAMALAAQVEAGNVGIVQGGKWVDDFLDEATAFPEASWSDQVDVTNGSFNKLASNYHGAPGNYGRLEHVGGIGTKPREILAKLKMKRGNLLQIK